MDMNDAISYVLRVGVVSSFLLIAAGAMLLFVDGSSNGFTLNQIANVNTGINSSSFTVTAIIDGLYAYQGLDFVMLGLIILIATPVLRVFLSVFVFLYEKNWLYLAITLIVFIDLMFAIFIVPGLLMN